MAAPGTAGAKKRKRLKRYPLEHTDQISTLLISMVPYAEIEKQCSLRWNKPRQYVVQVIAHVTQDWGATAAVIAETRRHQIRQAWEYLYRQCMAKSDLKAAAYVLTQLGKLDGCYAPESMDIAHSHTGSIGVGISLASLGLRSPEEVSTRIDELRARLAAQGPKALQAGQPSAVATAILAASTPPNYATPTSTTNGANGHAPSDIIDIDPDPDSNPGDGDLS